MSRGRGGSDGCYCRRLGDGYCVLLALWGLHICERGVRKCRAVASEEAPFHILYGGHDLSPCCCISISQLDDWCGYGEGCLDGQ